MKNLFMCVNYPYDNKAIGISKKIKTQIETFESLGYNVIYSAYLTNGVAIMNGDSILLLHEYKKNKINSLLRRFTLMNLCIDYLKDETFELGFIRWDAVDYNFLKVLSLLKAHCERVLIDFHGYFPKYNTPGIKGKYIKYTTKINGKKMAKYVDLGLTETKNTCLFNIPTLPMDTGIDINKYECHKYQGNVSEINMITVANETAYHGYDRILKGLYNYYKGHPTKIVKIHFVGKLSNHTLKSIEKYNLPQYIKVYGYKSGEELMNIYNNCNVGIGPLAPHRSGGKEGTGIKTKEYFAIGLPYFYAGSELLVPDDYPYVFRIESNDEPVDIEKIIEFHETVKKDMFCPTKMREFAQEHYSWEKIFTKALKCLKLR